MRYLIEASVTQPLTAQESSQQGMQLQPEVLAEPSCDVMSYLGTGDVHSGLILTAPATGHY